MAKIELVSPDGKVIAVEGEDQATKALAKQYRYPRVGEMVSPDGQVTLVEGDVQKALEAKYRPLQAPDWEWHGSMVPDVSDTPKWDGDMVPEAPPPRDPMRHGSSVATPPPAPVQWAVNAGNLTSQKVAPSYDEREAARIEAEKQQERNLQQEYGYSLLGQSNGEAAPSIFSAEGLQHAATAASDGILRGASLGFDAPSVYLRAGADQLAETVGGQSGPEPRTWDQSIADAKKDVQGYQEASPATAVGGEIMGAIAPALATGGESLLARGVANASLTNWVGRGAATLTARVLPREIPTLASVFGRTLVGVGSKLANSAAQGAINTGVYAASSTLNKAFLANDYTGVGERMLASGKDGALGGALFSTALTGSGLLYSKVKNAAYGPALHGDAVLPTAPDNLYKAVPAREVVDPETALNRGLRVSVVPNKQHLADLQDEIINTVSDDFDNTILPITSKVDSEAGLRQKKLFLEREGSYETPKGYEATLAEAGLGPEDIQQIVTDLHAKGMTRNGYDELNAALLDIETNTVKHGLPVPGQEPTAGQTFWDLDNAKRRFDAVLKIAQRQKNRESDNASYLYKVLSPKVDKLRSALEGEDVWGPLAKAQREINPSWAADIRGKSDDALKGFFQKTGDQDPFSPHDLAQQVNKKRLAAYLRNPNDVANDNDRKAILRLLDYREADLRTRARVLGSDELLSDADSLAHASQRIRENMDRAVLFARKFPGTGGDTVGKIGAGAVGLGLTGHLGLKAAGISALGPGAGAAGVGVGLVIAGRHVAGRLFTRRLYLNAIDVQSGLERAAKAFGKPSTLERTLTAPPVLKDVVQPAYKEILHLLDSIKEESQEEDPDKHSGLLRLEDNYGPQMAETYAQLNAVRNNFILSKAGDEVPDEDAARSLWKYIDPAYDPDSAFTRISEGAGTPEDRETLQTVYPSMYADFQDQALAHMESSNLTYQDELLARSRLGLPAMDPQKYADIQAIAATDTGAAKQADAGVLTPGNRRSPRIADIGRA